MLELKNTTRNETKPITILSLVNQVILESRSQKEELIES